MNEFESKFGDWQKLKLQENANEIPPGSMPRSIDVILKNVSVDKVKPGDKVVITGCLIVVPEASKLIKPGLKVYLEKTDQAERHDDRNKIKGLKDLGVREMSYKLAFLTQSVRRIVSIELPRTIMNTEAVAEIKVFNTLTDTQKVIHSKIKDLVSEDRNLQELCKLLAPHI